MNADELSKKRGEVIEKFINLEWIINAIISQHYFKKVVITFLLDILYDEYFTYALKRRILQKIVPDIDQQTVENMNRLNTIRNYFAHYNQEFFEGAAVPTSASKGRIPDPRNTNKNIDFDELYNEFMSKEKEVTRYLGKIYTDMGGELR